MVGQFPIAQYFVAQRPAVAAPAIDPSIIPSRSTQKREAAASIGLLWPGNRRGRGQPSLQTRYEDALRRHIRTHHAVPAGITTAERPSWWHPGNGFVKEPIVPAALDAAMIPSLEHLGDIPEGAVVNYAGVDDAAVPNSETHWQTPATLLPFVRALDEVMNPLGPVYKKAKKPFLEVFSVTCALVSFFMSLMAACHFLLVFVFHTVRNFPFHLKAQRIRSNTISSDGCLGSNNGEGCSEV